MNLNQIKIFIHIVCLFFLTITSVHSSYPPRNSKLIEMNLDNYKNIINENDSVVILFYENGCIKCTKWEKVINELIDKLFGEGLIADYLQAESDTKSKLIADKLSHMITFCKVDSFKYDEIAEYFEIESTPPSVKLIRNKYGIQKDLTKMIDTSALSSKLIFNFLKNNLIKEWKEIYTVDQLNEVNGNYSLNLILCGDNDARNLTLTEVIESSVTYFDNIILTKVLPISTSLLNYLNCTKKESKSENDSQIILYTNFDQNYIKYFDTNDNAIDKDSLRKWLEIYTNPPVMEFDEKQLKLITQKSIPTLIYFYLDDNKIDWKTFSIFYSFAKKLRGNVLFFKEKLSGNFGSNLIELFNVKENEIPMIIGLKIDLNNISEGGFSRYKLNSEITEKSVENFINGILENTLERYYLSESVNFTNPFYENGIFKFVGNNFSSEVDKSSKCVLIYTHSTSKILDEILTILKSLSNKLSDKVKVGMLNFELNEVSGIDEPYVLYLKTINNGELKRISGITTIKGIINFLADNNCIKPSNNDEISFDKEDEKEIKLINPFEIFDNPENYIQRENKESIYEKVSQISEDQIKTKNSNNIKADL
jgi:hypothetical protein